MIKSYFQRNNTLKKENTPGGFIRAFSRRRIVLITHYKFPAPAGAFLL
ncbi:hypothetical protein DCCM_1004 [Desulfocucumis palustris]|uniref:Uncharacterized protein n=1 Tax=Desulfocucumis palustris TaxID=1898651 RepID=A0A2L2X9J4_9FIRM|nr:hypothetical protein DCCM_1004 [Desulfocucumis palustris]